MNRVGISRLLAVGTAIAWCSVPSIGLGDSPVIDLPETAESAVAAPPIAIVSPSDDSIVDAGNIFIRAQVSDLKVTIASMEFHEGERIIGQCLTPPFSIIWSNVIPGHYTLTVRVTANAGQSATSAPVRIEARVPVTATLVRGRTCRLAPPIAS